MARICNLITSRCWSIAAFILVAAGQEEIVSFARIYWPTSVAVEEAESELFAM